MNLIILLRLLAAAAIGGVLGYERKHHGPHKAFGIAGMTLVAVGSTTYMLLAQHEAIAEPAVIGRAIQGILQGIGFLGGAVIFKGGTDVQGIKTATTIWIASAIGLAFGTGFWWLGAIVGVATALILFFSDRWSGEERDARHGGGEAGTHRDRAGVQNDGRPAG